ncbi:ankyrin repeat domain-containing protein [Legionella sp. CNM-4043-24]|uniref:ankyrin repeat domain-containing protein n=1 Tax=Legionella sp. CNM-4043-24 TaxID=3421646 RepID=UPI00403B2811
MTETKIHSNLIEQLEKIEGLDIFQYGKESCDIRLKSDCFENQLLVNNIMSAVDKLTSSLDNNETSKEISSEIITTIENLTGFEYVLTHVIADHSVSQPPSITVLSEIERLSLTIKKIFDAFVREKRLSPSVLEHFQFQLNEFEREFNPFHLKRRLSQEPTVTADQYNTADAHIIRTQITVKNMKTAIASEKARLAASPAAAPATMPMADQSVAASSVASSSSDATSPEPETVDSIPHSSAACSSSSYDSPEKETASELTDTISHSSAASSSSISRSPDDETPWGITNTIPRSAGHIKAGDKDDKAFLRKGFEILSKGDDAAALSSFLNEDENEYMTTSKDQHGQTLLHYAVYMGHCKSTELLIRMGVSMPAQTASGLQATHIAILRGHIDLLNVLVNKGCFAQEQLVKIKIGDQALSVNSLHLAVLCGHEKITGELLKRASRELPHRVNSQFNLLHLAVYADNRDMLAFLLNHPKLDNNEDLYNEHDRNGYAPLHLAIQRGLRDCVELLLRCDKVDKNRLTSDKRHPFQLDSREDPELSAIIDGALTSISLGSEDEVIRTGILPPNLQELKLFNCHLHLRTGAELLALIKALPSCLRNLILENTHLGYKKNGAELVAMIQALPQGLRSLSLVMNFLGRKSGAELLAIMQALPQGLHSLDLRENDFDEQTDDELIAILNAFRGRALIELKLDDELLARPMVKGVYDEVFGADARNTPQHETACLETASSDSGVIRLAASSGTFFRPESPEPKAASSEQPHRCGFW